MKTVVNYTHHSPFWQKEEFMEQENYGAEQENEVTPCPEEETLAVAEETVAELSEEATEEVTEEATEEPKKEKKPMKLWHMIVAGIASALLLIALAVVLLHGLGFEIAPKKDDTDTPDETPAFVANNDYTGSDKAFAKAADTVVATVGDKALTNRKLQMYYSMVVNDFVMSYYSYLSEVGLDYNKPLNEQQCYYDASLSWEEYFVDTALQTWINYQSVAMLAEESGYKLDAEKQKALEDLPAQLDAQAKESGYENAEALLAEEMNCTVAEYVDYWTLYQIGAGFTGQEPDEKTLEQYFEENKETYEASGITKDSGPIVDVRHILIQPEGGTTGEDGTTTYSDKEWKDCKKEAEAVLKQWKSGDADEDSFAALANEKSADGGSNTTGGLYAGITKDDSYVEPFLNWCMDKARKVGDTGIVKTEFGYHIMYFSATQEYWAYAASIDYIDDQTTKIIEQATEKWPAETDKTKICLTEIKLY